MSERFFKLLNYCRSQWWWGPLKVVSAISAFSLLFFVGKWKIYDRYLPITKVSQLLDEKKLERITLGNMLMICYFKGPGSVNQWKYCLSSLGPEKP
mmetsp:Transcript_40622/g.61899  ORF Transcript_40622/g.61899 Transcript_40622/m.61899 type:complete len:96 (+) Transcript_40622:106-393(+)